MYSAKQRACKPVSIGSSATSQLGASTPVRPASFIAASMSVGFMSGEPTIFSSFRLLVTVEWALMASTITSDPESDQDRAGNEASDPKTWPFLSLSSLVWRSAPSWIIRAKSGYPGGDAAPVIPLAARAHTGARPADAASLSGRARAS